jgi:hypothetical protein
LLAPGLMVEKTVWVSLNEINELQTKIMRLIDLWAHNNKTPIPLKLIRDKMKEEGIVEPSTIKALGVLLKKGYIRRAHTISNKTYFVQLRGV